MATDPVQPRKQAISVESSSVSPCSESKKSSSDLLFRFPRDVLVPSSANESPASSGVEREELAGHLEVKTAIKRIRVKWRQSWRPMVSGDHTTILATSAGLILRHHGSPRLLSFDSDSKKYRFQAN